MESRTSATLRRTVNTHNEARSGSSDKAWTRFKKHKDAGAGRAVTKENLEHARRRSGN